MKFVCIRHGELDSVVASGYAVGCRTKLMNELDLEGIEFRIQSPDGKELKPEHISSDAEEYLKKFADPYEQIVDAFDEYSAMALGLLCEQCGTGDETVQIEREEN